MTLVRGFGTDPRIMTAAVRSLRGCSLDLKLGPTYTSGVNLTTVTVVTQAA